MAFNMANKLGDQAQVLVDTGHHAQGANIEHIVAYLINEGKLGGFHFNSRKYADDDMIVGTANLMSCSLFSIRFSKPPRTAVPMFAEPPKGSLT